MPLAHSYVVFNNKGGVGKSTLAFHLSTEYAQRHPDENVLLIDMCPQASLSSTVYNTRDADGMATISELHSRDVTLNGKVQPHFPTNVCGYLASATATRPQHIARPEEYANFLVRPHERNRNIPPNILLLAGDGSLELQCRALDHTRRGMATVHDDPWLRITTLIKTFVQEVTSQPGDGRNWVVFIDTNPAFTIYTEMAIAAGTRLLVPCTADDYSLNALLAMFELIYGWANPNPTFSSYALYTFAAMARQHGMQLPKVHLFINNRTTVYRARSAAAFNAIQGAAADEGFRFYTSQLGTAPEPFPAYQVFTQPQAQGPCATAEEFRNRHFRNMQDMHQAAIVCSHVGCPLYALTGGVVTIGNEQIRFNNDDTLRGYRDAITALAAEL